MEIPRYNGHNIPTWRSRPTGKFIKETPNNQLCGSKRPCLTFKMKVPENKNPEIFWGRFWGECYSICPSSHIRVKEWVHLPLAHVRREELQEGHPEGSAGAWTGRSAQGYIWLWLEERWEDEGTATLAGIPGYGLSEVLQSSLQTDLGHKEKVGLKPLRSCPRGPPGGVKGLHNGVLWNGLSKTQR